MNKQEALDALELYHRNMEHILGPEDEKVKTIETCIKLIEEIEDEMPTQANALNALDTIYRQAAIDAMMALQAEDDEAYGCHIPEGFDGERAKEALEHLPSAQPEIVRCVECKWFQCNMQLDGYLPKGVDEFECRHWCGSCDPTDFCSYAERKWEEVEDENIPMEYFENGGI